MANREVWNSHPGCGLVTRVWDSSRLHYHPFPPLVNVLLVGTHVEPASVSVRVSMHPQDLPNCSAVCKLNGIPPLLHLLQSEFPVIQQLVLRTLERITSDAEARSALRGEQGFLQLLDLLSSRVRRAAFVPKR